MISISNQDTIFKLKKTNQTKGRLNKAKQIRPKEGQTGQNKSRKKDGQTKI